MRFKACGGCHSVLEGLGFRALFWWRCLHSDAGQACVWFQHGDSGLYKNQDVQSNAWNETTSWPACLWMQQCAVVMQS